MPSPAGLPEDKRRRIVDAALREFTERGYAGASTNAITAAAGISKGLLFHYWGSKAGLYLYLIEDCIERYVVWARRSVAAEPPQADLVDRLMAKGLRKLQFLREDPVLWHFLEQAWLEPPPEVAAEIRALAERYRPAAMEALGLGVDTSRLRPGVDLARAIRVIMIYGDGLQSVYTRASSAHLDAAEAVLAEVAKDLEIFKYGIYRQPEAEGQVEQ